MRKHIAISFLFFLKSFSFAIAEDRPPEFKDFEEIAIHAYDALDWYVMPNMRQFWIGQASRYEVFASKYPNSPLVAEAKLQAASIYRTIDNVEVSEIRAEARNCVARSSRRTYKELCEVLFDLKILNIPKDKFFLDKSIRMFLDIAERFGHEKRYVMRESQVGGLVLMDEDAGGYALMLMAYDVSEKNRRSLYNIVLKNYRIRAELRESMENYLKEE